MAKYKCTECGGTNLQVKAWVSLNKLDNKTIKTTAIELPEDEEREDYWCMDCEDHIIPEEAE